MKNSTSTRLAYAMMLLLGTVVSAIMLIPGLGESLKKILPGICSGVGVPLIINQEAMFDCTSILGYVAVYRICFALACFYFLFMVIIIIFLLICFSSSVKCIKHKPKIDSPSSNSTAPATNSTEGGHRRLLMELLSSGMLLDA